MDINTIIARRVRDLRDQQKLSLDALAKRSGVSRSNISLIERGESSPTAAALDKLAVGLGVTLASLFEDSTPAAAALPVSRLAEQVCWTDPASGYMRRNLSPGLPSPLQLVEVEFPAGQTVRYDSFHRDVDIQQQVWIMAGQMRLSVGEQVWDLQTGDCLSMGLDKPITFHNPGKIAARYLVALCK
ncbi:transcriptional regulator [Undibacterium sp. YM2]|uniref:helix-turn-helix domain-containing protein n=1 Tax=Undibacterium sp. YM2 TaxID=2058625 RepID=UPI001331DC7F|nr:XRE family transcriptional regulator [Undibacterium sp. YM2]BBB69591.1 transcriptional regulator [Undibacterium sp. YM2]